MTVFKICISITLIILFYKFFFRKTLTEFNSVFELKKRGITTIGKVVGIEESTDLDGLTMYLPFIEFLAMDGKVYKFEQNDHQMKKPLLGESVKVKYSKINPNHAIIDKGIVYKFVVLKIAIGVLTLGFLITIAITNILTSL